MFDGRWRQSFEEGLKPVGANLRRTGITADHLTATGVDEGTEQRLRNVFRLFPIAQLRNAPPIAQPSIGQLLGIAWLAWFFERSVDGLRR